MTSPTPRLLSDFAQNRYLTYPHANGFADGGKSILLGQLDETTISIWKIDLATGAENQLCSFALEPEPEKLIWFDVALKSNQLAFIAEHSVWLMEIAKPESLRRLYRAPEGQTLSSLCSVTEDGKTVLCGLKTPEIYAALRVNTASGHGEIVFLHTWYANHFHFCPHDESWIGYCHEGPTEKVHDRLWAWNAMLEPRGTCLFDQTKQGLCFGHERWEFHQTATLAIAYGVSPGGPRGLYEAFPDGRPPRLVSEGDRDFHCGISRDGRWAAVDTTGPHDAPGKGWENASDISDVLLVDMHTGARHFLARSRQYMRHPRHPHPTFNLDGSAIFYNESSPDTTRNRVWMVANPGWTKG